MSARAATIAALAVALGCGAGASEDDATSGAGEALSAARINGGTTGAMVRETTDAGFSCVSATWTLPDADPSEPGSPWVYYGLGDERSIDVEAGMAFQKGDPSRGLPHRWLPYMRHGAAFVFGGEETRAMPGDTFTLEARLEGGAVSLWKDGERVELRGAGGAVSALDVGLDAARAHVRRVVGQAVSTRYDGGELGKLGPVVFASTRVCAADGSRPSFADVAGWRVTDANGVLHGSVRWPAPRTRHVRDEVQDVDEITLFP